MIGHLDTAIELNTKIRAVLERAKAEIVEIGKPDFFMSPGFDFEDVVGLLDDAMPQLTGEMLSRAEDWAQDQDAEDRADEAATYADFRRDQRLEDLIQSTQGDFA